jgi:glycolate oxidase
MALDFVTNEEVVQAARKNVFQGVWDYLVGGAETETTFRRNRLAFDRLAFRPRVLVDVSDIDSSGTLLGHKLRIPVVLAPIGSLQVFTPEGGAASSKAAHEFGIVHVVSSATEPSLEEIAAANPGPKVYQLYIRGDDTWVEDRLKRMLDAGYQALCITVDTAVDSIRERPLLTRWAQPTRRRDPLERQYSKKVTWDTVARYKQRTGLPLLVKGIATAEDADLAVQHGVDVVWVSNHGGRQLDHGLGSMDTLPEIAQAVAGRAEIILDGGVSRGSDVLKALALGANAVAIGRLQGYGLAAGGKEGLLRALEILEGEIRSAMGLLGVTKVSQLNPKYLAKAEAVTMPHEHSAWVNMPGGRVR